MSANQGDSASGGEKMSGPVEESATGASPDVAGATRPWRDDTSEWQKYLAKIPLLHITREMRPQDFTSTTWAELVDVSQPVPEFDEKKESMAMTFAFNLDNFQKQAILKLEEGHHVLVSAHTSAGKTVIADYAIAISRRNKKKVIYTSPTKALSNQKYNDFCAMFGDVGLLTGDLQINPTGSCLVMTTEILRSMLYYNRAFTDDLECVIFDEVHYINNVERGHVWEETIILLPQHVTMVMLSATVPNTLQFAAWVGCSKQRKVYVVSTTKRPVPLCHYLYTGRTEKSRNEMFLVLDQDSNFKLKGYNDAVAAKSRAYYDLFEDYGQRMSRSEKEAMWRMFGRYLQDKNLVPVVAFTLSRKRCDQNADGFRSSDLTTETEKQHITCFFDNCIQRLNDADRNLDQVQWLKRSLIMGVGVHHSGILPILKEIVEMLFQGGYVKLLFATETFAIGMNMPAKTVVFEEITKFDGVVNRVLSPAEYIQMAGRAGRRGLDDTGTVILLCKERVPKLETLEALMLAAPQELSSQFRLTYAMILNWSRRRSATETITGMMQLSFRQCNQLRYIAHYRKQLDIAERKYAENCGTPLADHLKPLVKYYNTAGDYIAVLDEAMPMLLTNNRLQKEMVDGRILVVSVGKYINQLAVLLTDKGPSKRTPYRVLLLDTKYEDEAEYAFADENWYLMLGFSAKFDYIGSEFWTLQHTLLYIGHKNVMGVSRMRFNIDPKLIMTNWENRQLERFKDSPVGRACADAVKKLAKLSCDVRSGAVELEMFSVRDSLTLGTRDEFHLLDKYKTVSDKIEAIRHVTDRENFVADFAMVYERKQVELNCETYRQLLSIEKQDLYNEYMRRLHVLQELGYIEKNVDCDATPKGRVARRLGTNEIIVTELIYGDQFKNLNSAEMAAVLSSVVYEGPGEPKCCTLPDAVVDAVNAVRQIDLHLTHLEKYHEVNYYEGQRNRVNVGLVASVYEWARQQTFGQILQYTDVQAGIVARCILQLNELIINLKDAAARMGDADLEAKMLEASVAIKRDIVSTPTLYTSISEKVELLPPPREPEPAEVQPEPIEILPVEPVDVQPNVKKPRPKVRLRLKKLQRQQIDLQKQKLELEEQLKQLELEEQLQIQLQTQLEQLQLREDDLQKKIEIVQQKHDVPKQ